MILCGLFEWKRICTDLSVNCEYKEMYMYCRWNPVIKRGGLGSSYQEGGLGSSYQEGGWDPVIKRGGLGSH